MCPVPDSDIVFHRPMVRRENMEMGMQTPSLMGDTFGVPTYFVDTAITEDAGNGIVRIWNCSSIGGLLVPQCGIIIHSVKLVIAGRQVGDFGEKVFNENQFRMVSLPH